MDPDPATFTACNTDIAVLFVCLSVCLSHSDIVNVSSDLLRRMGSDIWAFD